ncbi:RNA binding repeat protein, Pumilio-family [Teladorsagia circumcincta]|uniref:RNA binding repeat protein, Pumilio-family n=1 Tax=Teladorsagia circumcincta TaxID=45464 RepID=A0A2G9UGQ3_TELCI|nr:RNA binding repeat protein, Pumilio-family [Teladorsagia circumcincta]
MCSQHILHFVFSKDLIRRYLQANYPSEGKPEREMLAKLLFEQGDFFTALCMDVFGNFFIQCAVQNATAQEQRWITSHLFGKLYPMCMNRYSCRVIQKVIECLPEEMKGLLMLELHNKNLVDLCTDQNANHVIQKIMTTFSFVHWQFIVEQFIRNKNELFCVAENKYGCRVVQLAIELLSDTDKCWSSVQRIYMACCLEHSTCTQILLSMNDKLVQCDIGEK